MQFVIALSIKPGTCKPSTIIAAAIRNMTELPMILGILEVLQLEKPDETISLFSPFSKSILPKPESRP